MAWTPISGTVPQYSTSANELASDYWLKFYLSGTTTPYSVATDSTGASTLAKIKLSNVGYPISNPLDNDTIFIPHVEVAYRIVLYQSEADADANDTANAAFNIDGISPDIAQLATDDNIAMKGTTLQGQDDYDRSPLFVNGTDFTAGAGPHTITVPSEWTPTNADMRFYRLASNGVVTDLTPTSKSATTFTIAETLLSTDTLYIGDDTFRNQMDGDPADIRARLELGTAATTDATAYATAAQGNNSVQKSTVITGHVRAGNTQLLNGGVTVSGEEMTAQVTQNVFSTAGPTGSGADVILSDMDDIPTNATVVIFTLRLVFEFQFAGFGALKVFATKGGETAGQSDANNLIGDLAGETGTGTVMRSSNMIFIPLDSSRRFRVTYNETNTDTIQAFLYYRGFMTD